MLLLLLLMMMMMMCVRACNFSRDCSRSSDYGNRLQARAGVPLRNYSLALSLRFTRRKAISRTVNAYLLPYFQRHTDVVTLSPHFISLYAVASLEWVAPGAATEGVTPIFPEKNLTFFSHHRHVTSIHFTRVSPPGVCHPAPFSPVRPRLSSILCKFAHKNFSSFWCHPLESVTPVGPPPQ